MLEKLKSLGRQVVLLTSLSFALTLLSACEAPKRPYRTAEDSAKKQPKPVATHVDVKKKQGQATPQPKPEKKELTEEQKKLVVAKVNDYQVTLGEYWDRLNAQPPYARMRYNSLERKKEFLQNLVQFEVLAQEAKRLGYDKDPQVLFAMKQQMIKLLITKHMEEAAKLEDISDADIKKYYDEHQELYHKPEQVRVSHILLADKAKAEAVLKELKEQIAKAPKKSRQLFSEMVKQRSKDEKTKKFNGDLRYLSADKGSSDASLKVPKAVVDAAFKLQKVNELSGVVKSEQGYHILMLTHRRPKIDRSLEDVKRQIQNKLFRERRRSIRDEFIKKLRDKSKIQIFDEHLKLVQSLSPDATPGMPPRFPHRPGPRKLRPGGKLPMKPVHPNRP